MKTEVHFSSERGDWSTPRAFFDALDHGRDLGVSDFQFNFALDVCAEPHNAKAPLFLTPEINALDCRWNELIGDHEWAWMNPPYGHGIIDAFVGKAFREVKLGLRGCVCLLPSRTDTQWWHSFVMRAAEVYLVKGRLRFDEHENSAPFPSAIVVFDRNNWSAGQPVVRSLTPPRGAVAEEDDYMRTPRRIRVRPRRRAA